ncbi:MAG: hypothetical protein ACK5PB_01535, partial [Pirellula sp.]
MNFNQADGAPSLFTLMLDPLVGRWTIYRASYTSRVGGVRSRLDPSRFNASGRVSALSRALV